MYRENAFDVLGTVIRIEARSATEIGKVRPLLVWHYGVGTNRCQRGRGTDDVAFVKQALFQPFRDLQRGGRYLELKAALPCRGQSLDIINKIARLIDSEDGADISCQVLRAFEQLIV